MKAQSEKPQVDAIDAILDGLEPEGPLADMVVDFLDEGALLVDEREVERAAQRLERRLAGRPQPVRWSPALMGGLAAAAAFALAVVTWGTPAVQVADAPSGIADPAPVSSSEALTLSEGTVAHRRGDTVVLADGTLRFRREGELRPEVDAVYAESVNVRIEPVGTVFVVAADDAGAVVGVQQGVVRLVDSDETEIGRLQAGEWGALERRGGEVGLSAFAVGEQPEGVSDEVRALLVEARWLALPEGTREAVDDLDLPAAP